MLIWTGEYGIGMWKTGIFSPIMTSYFQLFQRTIVVVYVEESSKVMVVMCCRGVFCYSSQKSLMKRELCIPFPCHWFWWWCIFPGIYSVMCEWHENVFRNSRLNPDTSIDSLLPRFSHYWVRTQTRFFFQIPLNSLGVKLINTIQLWRTPEHR